MFALEERYEEAMAEKTEDEEMEALNDENEIEEDE